MARNADAPQVNGPELLRRLRTALQQRPVAPPPPHDGPPRAAVVAILRATGPALELLMIKRAEHDRDPWSGHVALPGGREEPVDGSLAETAIRETREEVGIDLDRDGVLYGALDDLSPLSAPVAVFIRPFVAELRVGPTLRLSDEVAAAFWVPVETLLSPAAVVESVVRVRGVERRVRSFRHGEHIVWGLTERILTQLVGILRALALP